MSALHSVIRSAASTADRISCVGRASNGKSTACSRPGARTRKGIAGFERHLLEKAYPQLRKFAEAALATEICSTWPADKIAKIAKDGLKTCRGGARSSPRTDGCGIQGENSVGGGQRKGRRAQREGYEDRQRKSRKGQPEEYR